MSVFTKAQLTNVTLCKMKKDNNARYETKAPLKYFESQGCQIFNRQLDNNSKNLRNESQHFAMVTKIKLDPGVKDR